MPPPLRSMSRVSAFAALASPSRAAPLFPLVDSSQYLEPTLTTAALNWPTCWLTRSSPDMTESDSDGVATPSC